MLQTIPVKQSLEKFDLGSARESHQNFSLRESTTALKLSQESGNLTQSLQNKGSNFPNEETQNVHTKEQIIKEMHLQLANVNQIEADN
jgi:hypothetical protein